MSAVFSNCGLYRWRLERHIAFTGPVGVSIGVNASTADAERDDQTLRKDQGFARRLGWGRLIKGNMFGLRSTDIRALAAVADPIGSENDAHLEAMMREADVVVAAWGARNKLPPALRDRWRDVAAIADRLGKPLYCFGTCGDGQPLHTQTIGYDRELCLWERPR